VEKSGRVFACRQAQKLKVRLLSCIFAIRVPVPAFLFRGRNKALQVSAFIIGLGNRSGFCQVGEVRKQNRPNPKWGQGRRTFIFASAPAINRTG
jgi:hypothetical protein